MAGYAISVMALVTYVRGWLLAGSLLSVLTIGVGIPSSTAQGLADLNRVALQKSSFAWQFRVVAVCGQFQNTESVSVQLWTPEHIGATRNTNTSYYVLDWQKLITPTVAKAEILPIPFTDQFTVRPDHMLGVFSRRRPGPLVQQYQQGRDMVTSLLDDTNAVLPPPVGSRLEFDDLSFPYRIPIVLCDSADCSNQTDCPLTKVTKVDDLVDMTTVSDQGQNNNGGKDGGKANGGGKVQAVGLIANSRFEEVIRSTEFMIGLLVWNIALTVIVFVLICVIMCIIGDMEKRERREKRVDNRTLGGEPSTYAYENFEGSGGGGKAAATSGAASRYSTTESSKGNFEPDTEVLQSI